jgi:hypothetical protein
MSNDQPDYVGKPAASLASAFDHAYLEAYLRMRDIALHSSATEKDASAFGHAYSEARSRMCGIALQMR